MARKRDLVVNDLARYAKSSERLVLEEYSSCEVPAGCGGGILRWIDPAEALPLHLRLWATGEAELFFDGAPTRSSRLDARPGRHVLALRVTPKDRAPPQLALALSYSDETLSKGAFEPGRSRSIGRKIAILSGAGPRIVATSIEPAGDAWRQPGFDDGAWSTLTREEPPQKSGEREDYHLRHVRETGAHVLGLRGARGPLWVRCSFEIDLDGAQGSAAGGTP